MTRKQRRGVLIGVSVGVLMVAVGLVLYRAARFHRLLSYPERHRREARPSRASASAWAASSPPGSVKRGEGAKVDFVVTDTLKDIPVTYEGVLPDLFREGQGVVAEGKLTPAGAFVADTVLAKHDETYMPPEVAKALQAKGVKLGKGATHPSGAMTQ